MSRRLEKLTRTVRDVVSEVVQTQLSDPRISGIASVTRVKLAPDLSFAKIYLSILAVDPQQEKLSFEGINHARGFIQSRLAGVLTTRICPVLSFHLDESLKKGFEVSQLIERAAAEYRIKDNDNNETDEAGVDEEEEDDDDDENNDNDGQLAPDDRGSE